MHTNNNKQEIKEVNHTPERENDLQKLCAEIISISPNRYYNPNGPDESSCPFCYELEYGTNADIGDIEHKIDCAYLIAKDLSTNL